MDSDYEKRAKKRKVRRNLISSIKIGAGSALAIFIAAGLQLPNAPSAGTITLLTLIAQTRRDTVKLTFERLLTFVITVVLCFLIVPLVKEVYIGYAIFLLFAVFIGEMLGWQATLSVNAVIAAHFILNKDFSTTFILQEFGLLVIGITIALTLNWLQPDLSGKEELIERMHQVDTDLQEVLREMAELMRNGSKEKPESQRLLTLQHELEESIEHAARFGQNTFVEEDRWLLPYFQMRLEQCVLLKEIYHRNKGGLQASPTSHMASGYVESLIPLVHQGGCPVEQLEENRNIREKFVESCRDNHDFETDAMTLFILIDLYEYTDLKREFLENLSEKARIGYETYHQTSCSCPK